MNKMSLKSNSDIKKNLEHLNTKAASTIIYENIKELLK